MDELMAEHTDWHTLQAHCELFVSSGGVPRKNAQIAVGGTAQHHVRDGLHRLADHGVRFVNISPVRNDLVSGGLVEWWPIRPNTDTALILGLAPTQKIGRASSRETVCQYVMISGASVYLKNTPSKKKES